MHKQLTLYYPQWQGSGPDRSVYHGARELRANYLAGFKLKEVPVDIAGVTRVKNNIFGYDELLKQIRAASDIIMNNRPEKIFTVGGGCDAGVVPLAYLNGSATGALTVVWFDAHGDLNTPQSSKSKFFYGMPLRTLLGEGDTEMLKFIPRILEPSQVILAGARDLERAEMEYLDSRKITRCGVQSMEYDNLGLSALVRAKGKQQVYIHLDLDVLDPAEFPHVAVPVRGGLKIKTLSRLIEKINDEFSLVGLGIFEYKPSGLKSTELLNNLFQIGLNLN
jgi:arginase